MKTCMNISCVTKSSSEWKTGWKLRSGEFANLCDKCGYAFEQQIYCEEFHSDDSGWRNCVTCDKRLHCGCVASFSLVELLDGGGVKCVSCAAKRVPNLCCYGAKGNSHGVCSVTENNEGVCSHTGSNGCIQKSIPLDPKANAAVGVLKHERHVFPTEEALITTQPPPPSTDTAVISGAWRATWAPTLGQTSMRSFFKDRLNISSNNLQTKDANESVTHQTLNISLGAPSGNLRFTSGTITDERAQRKMSNSFNQGFLSPSPLPSLPKLPFSPGPDTNLSTKPKLRAGRPPGEGGARPQLLPRYWPRITDQELKQICGDTNCTILPLFEKVLSASDAGRIGRLVLPKTCAEAYFPPISQSEGLPMNIQDVNGKNWVFQFRFWPNNNSRMYVLEGVTPCIQSMELQAGDTVTFSRKDPGGNLVMGFRKALNSCTQDLPVIEGCSSILQSTKGGTDSHMNAGSSQLDSGGGNVNLHNNHKFNELTEGGLSASSMMVKKGRRIGSKNKRFHVDNQEDQSLRLTMEEAQGMLRPPPNAKPTIVVIDDFEFEEYEEPPVIGKSSVFAAHSSGMIDQWAQCDSCSKWRRLPAEDLLPPRWVCADNTGDPIRCFCSASDEPRLKELENFSNLSKGSKKKKMAIANGAIREQESSGLSALANAAVLGDNSDETGTSAVPTTSKHPRHRPGCSCIVCIQPPSGKGKHKSTCTCTVCMTVKRRFKTLMMRKKKRQSDQSGEIVLKNHQKENPNIVDDRLDVESSISLLENDSLQTELAPTADDEDQNFSGASPD